MARLQLLGVLGLCSGPPASQQALPCRVDCFPQLVRLPPEWPDCLEASPPRRLLVRSFSCPTSLTAASVQQGSLWGLIPRVPASALPLQELTALSM